MALYLVVHQPEEQAASAESVRPPSRLPELARASIEEGGTPRWLRTWSPDLHDERIFSLWEAQDAAEITAALERFGFLDNMAAQPLRVREWGPAEVLAADA